MALPVNNVNTVGGAEVRVPPMRMRAEHEEIKTQRFRHICQHYLQNTGRSVVPVYDHAAGYDTYSEGWAIIRYTDLKAAMSFNDYDMINLTAKKYRVKSQGFNIMRINCVQQNVAVSAATATINASFQSAPSVIVFKDTDNDLYEHTFEQTEVMAGGSRPAWKTITPGINKEYNVCYDNSIAAATLKEVKFAFPNVVTPTVVDMAQNFTLMHHGELEWLSAGDKYSHHWENPNKDWFSPNLAADNLGLETTPFTNDVLLIGNTVEMNENSACGVPFGQAAVPEMVLIRAPPIRDSLGVISMLFEIMIEYYVEIEWVTGRYWNTVNVGQAAPTPILTERRFYPTNRRHLRHPISDVMTVKRLQTGKQLQSDGSDHPGQTTKNLL